MSNKTGCAIIAGVVLVLVACALMFLFLVPFTAATVGLVSGAVSSGPVTTESRNVSDIHAVNFATVGEMTITQGDTESLTIRAEDRILRQIKTEVNNGVLSIRIDQAGWNTMNTTKGIYYTLTVKRLDGITLSGAGNIHATNIKSDSLAVTLSGAGSLEITGEAGDQNVRLSGAGSYAGGNLKSQTVNVELTGMGSATVWATDKLDARISSVGSVNYYGSPQVNKSITGLGGISGLGSK